MKYSYQKLVGPRRTVQCKIDPSYTQNPPYKGDKHGKADERTEETGVSVGAVRTPRAPRDDAETES